MMAKLCSLVNKILINVKPEQGINQFNTSTLHLCKLIVKQTEHNFDLLLLEVFANDVPGKSIYLGYIEQHVNHAYERHRIF